MEEIPAITPEEVERLWPVPRVDSDKYSRGVVGLDTGSVQYPGAALLGCAGALHAGAGMVRYVGPALPELVLARFPSVVTADGRVQAMVLGSGWGETASPERLVAALERDVPLVLDADALTLLPVELPEQCLLTPHAGELAKLLDRERAAVQADPVGHVRRAAETFGATVLLKGATQYVGTPDGAVTTAVPGPSWTAQAGSGDVLAGACGTLLAAGMSAHHAALLAASLQAMAAVAFPGPHPPDRLAEGFADVLGRLFPQS